MNPHDFKNLQRLHEFIIHTGLNIGLDEAITLIMGINYINGHRRFYKKIKFHHDDIVAITKDAKELRDVFINHLNKTEQLDND